MFAHIFNPTAEVLIPIATQTNEENAEIDSQSLIAEIKIRKHSK